MGNLISWSSSIRIYNFINYNFKSFIKWLNTLCTYFGLTYFAQHYTNVPSPYFPCICITVEWKQHILFTYCVAFGAFIDASTINIWWLSFSEHTHAFVFIICQSNRIYQRANRNIFVDSLVTVQSNFAKLYSYWQYIRIMTDPCIY